jgi:hypothetical protein
MINPTINSSKKCVHCGLRNFPDKTICQRCKSDLSLPFNVASSDKQMHAESEKSNRSKFSAARIFAALVVVVLLALALLFMRTGPEATAPLEGNMAVTQTPVTPETEQPRANSIEQDSQSDAAATQVITELKRFQNATETGMDYAEYDRQLNKLKADLNATLPSFVRHNPTDETFREEVAGALREYTAARNWWKTTVANSTVFTEADRNERTQRNWASARTHITNAEKASAN